MGDIHSRRSLHSAFITRGRSVAGTASSGDIRITDSPARIWIAPDVKVPDAVAAADWLAPRLSGNATGTPVRAIIPAGFEAYARVLHPARRGHLGKEPVRWSEVAAWSGRVVHPEMQWEAIVGPIRVPESPPPHESEPRRGDCQRDVLEPLAEHLRRHTATPDDCWVCMWEGFAGVGDSYPDFPRVHLSGRDYLFLNASLDQVVAGVLQTDMIEDWESPNIWWPDDKSWCVATEIDLSWTYVGGTRACIDAILGDARLEAMEALLDQRADYLSDTINGPVRPY